MSQQLAQGLRAWCGYLAVWGLLGGVGQAHVRLNSPNGGESLQGGSEFAIEWHVEKTHNTLNWDLWYSTVNNEGPWQEIAFDLPAGDTSENAVHTFDWTLPNINISSAWVRVRQDNAGMDYFGISEASFSIAATRTTADFTGDGSIDAADLAAWEQGFGTPSTATPPNGDADLDRDVDGADFLAWQSQYQGASTLATVHSVPEPAATILLLLGMAFLLWHRRH